MLIALGLDPSRVPSNIYQQLGHILRTVVHGLIHVLQSRMEVKSNFRMPVTSIRPVENNPLKFSLNTEDALHNLFVKRNPGYLSPVDAFEEGFQDIAYHQMAMLAGIRAAFNAMLANFHPDHLEVVYERKLRRATFFQLGNRFRYWGMYRAQFEDIEKNMEAHFQLLFGEEFAKAYNDQLQKLTSSARREPR
jgi:type VI secretion system protein